MLSPKVEEYALLWRMAWLAAGQWKSYLFGNQMVRVSLLKKMLKVMLADSCGPGIRVVKTGIGRGELF